MDPVLTNNFANYVCLRTAIVIRIQLSLFYLFRAQSVSSSSIYLPCPGGLFWFVLYGAQYVESLSGHVYLFIHSQQ